MEFAFFALISAALSFCFLFVVFVPIEKAFPAKPGQKIFRPHWFTDLAFFAGQYLLWSLISVSILQLLHPFLFEVVPAEFRDLAARQELWVQALMGIFLGDFCLYWFHRWQHSSRFLWRFHAVHHSSEHLDWLAAHREHPVDGIMTQFMINLPAALLGIPLSLLSALIAFRGIWAIFIHSNVSIPLGPLRMLCGSPDLHHWHHSKEIGSSNFANLCPLIDWVFGTYRAEPEAPREFGVIGMPARGYLKLLWGPFVRCRRN